jgi:hypothetical protein
MRCCRAKSTAVYLRLLLAGSAAAFLLASAAPAQAAITRINYVHGSKDDGDNNLTATWTSPSSTTLGNLLVAVVAVRGGTGTTITPPAGQSWVLARRSDNGTNVSIAIYYIKNAAVQSGSQTWTVSGLAKGTLQLMEYAGVDKTAPLDLTASSSGTGTDADTGTGTPTSEAAEVAVGGVSAAGNANFSGLTSGYTKLAPNEISNGNPNSSKNRTEVYEDLFTGASVPASSITIGSSEDWVGAMATFKAAAVYWIGSTAGTFTDTTRWSGTSGGSSSGLAPGTTDQVIFDSGGTGNCSISAATQIDSIELRTGYSGTVTLTGSNTLQLAHDLTVGAGTFTASGGAVTFDGLGTVKGSVYVSGGTLNGGGSDFTPQDLGVSLGTYNTGSGALTVKRNFTMSGGSVSAGGTDKYSTSSGSATISGGTYTNASSSITTFSNPLALSGTGALTLTAGQIKATAAATMAGSATLTGASGTTVTFSGTLGMTGGTITTAGSTFALNGNVTISGGTYNNTGSSTSTTGAGNTLALSSTGAFSVASGTFHANAGVSLAGSATYTAASGTTNTLDTTLGVGGGTFDLNSGTLTVSGAVTVSGGTFKGGGTSTLSTTLDVSSGTFDLNSGSVSVAGAVTVSGGTYKSTSGASTFTRATSPTLTVSSGTYDANGGSSAVTNLVSLTGGTYKIGSSATGQTLSGGMTIAGGTLDGSSSTGLVKLANGKTLSMTSGTIQTSTAVATGPTINSVSGTYAFSVTGGTVSINGLKVIGTDNTTGVSFGTGATLSKLDYVNFANIPASNPGSTSYLLSINQNSLNLTTTGCKFDYNTTTFSNLKTVHLTDANGGGNVRVYFQNQSTAVNGTAAGDSADADEDTSPDDGVGDTGGLAVAYWDYAVATDTVGTIQGFPSAAFDWSTFSFYSVYIAFNDVGGAGTADRIYIRNSNGDPISSTDIPNSDGNIVGTPCWNTEGTNHVLYVGTSGGKIYKFIDTAGVLALASSPWNSVFSSATVSTITSPLITDGTNIYFAGTNASSSPRIFGVSVSGKALVKDIGAAATITAAPSWAVYSGTTYLFVGSAASASQAYIYRLNVVPSALVDATCLQATASINASTTLLTNVLYAGDSDGKLHGIDASNFGVGGFANKSGFPYQDTSHSPATNGAIQTAPYIDWSISRIFFGDKDGHLYQISLTGTLSAGYPIRLSVTNELSSPFYYPGSGVIVVGDSGGNVYYVDQKNASSVPSVFYTTTLNGSVSKISYNANAGQYMLGTASGQFIYLPLKADPTPTFTYN